MSIRFLNSCIWTPTSGGTSTWTVGAAVAPYRTPANCVTPAVVDGGTYRYFAVLGTAYERGYGVYTASGATLTRLVEDSTNGGAAVNFASPPTVYMGSPLAEDIIVAALRYDSAQSLSASEKNQALANLGMPPSSLPLGFRNRFINGGMAIDQRNAGAAQTITAGAALAYTVDRWYAYCTGANVTGQRVAGSAQSQYRYQFTGAASVTKIGFAQRIAAANIYNLNSKTVTLSVDLANSLLTTVTWTAWYANSTDAFGTLASPSRTQIATGTFTVNSTVTRYSTQISLPASATNGVEVEFSVAAQTSGTFTIGDAQLEAGGVATPFEIVPAAVQLLNCLYYFELLGSSTGLESYGVGQVASSSRALGFYPFKVTKRAAPTFAVSSASHWAFVNASITVFSAWSTITPQTSVYGASFDVTGMSGLGSAGDAALWGPNNTSSAKIRFDAEL